MLNGEYQLFYVYSETPKDARLLAELEKALTLLLKEGFIRGWHVGRMLAGANIQQTIARELEQADIILLLLSPDFFATASSNELMHLALQRQQACVVPILLRYCYWEASPLKDLKILPANRTPVTGWSDPDAAYLNITQGLRQVVGEVAASQAKQEARTKA